VNNLVLATHNSKTNTTKQKNKHKKPKKEINRERWTNTHTHKQTGNKTIKQTNTQKNSRFWNNRISVLVVLVLLLQHPLLMLILSRGSVLVSPGV
jgi:hypothetical protein